MDVVGIFIEFLIAGGVAVGFLTAVFLVAHKLRRYDLVDSAWGMTFICIALTSYVRQGDETGRLNPGLLVTVLVLVWGLRLSLHIFSRFRMSHHEDPRYIELRATWKGNVARNVFLRIYMIQAVLAVGISTAVLLVHLLAGPVITPLMRFGSLVWLFGFAFEAIGDRQLKQFLREPRNRGKIMQSGLWKYSRHPNYFGELVQWYGICFICLAVPYGWVGVISPLLITYLIVFVSGIPPSESRFEGRPGWDDYKRRTSALIPMPPARG